MHLTFHLSAAGSVAEHCPKPLMWSVVPGNPRSHFSQRPDFYLFSSSSFRPVEIQSSHTRARLAVLCKRTRGSLTYQSFHPCQVLREDSTPGRLSARPGGCTFMHHSHHHPAYASGYVPSLAKANCLICLFRFFPGGQGLLFSTNGRV